MIQIGNYTLSFETNIFFVLLGIVLLFLYTYFIYKFTIPQISSLKKILLISLRASAAALLLTLIFEPTFIIRDTETIEPENFVFIDNSKSMVLKDSSSRVEEINRFIGPLKEMNEAQIEFYSFGGEVRKIEKDSLGKLNFDNPRTNFENVFAHIRETNNTGSVTLITDGIINDGFNPVYEAEKLGIPVYTVGVGDTSETKDVLVKNVYHNKFIYQNTTTQIAVDIGNANLHGREVRLTLSERNQPVESREIHLSETGVNRVTFDYTPSEPGEKRLAFSVEEIDEEDNTSNNYKPFYINVLKNKLNILFIAGSPSADLSILQNSLRNHEEFRINSIVQIHDNLITGTEQKDQKLDSADVVIMIGFPPENSAAELTDQVVKTIERRNIPFMYLTGAANNFGTPNSLSKLLPFTVANTGNDQLLAQPVISGRTNQILPGEPGDWNKLPPVYYAASDINSKAGAETLVNSKIRNIETQMPMIISSSAGKQRTLALLASEIWRWKLQASDAELFDKFFYNAVKWLNADRTKSNFDVETDRRFYSIGEEVIFTAQLYDESLAPKNDASVRVEIEGLEIQTSLDNIGNGLYTGSIRINKSGDYNYKATASDNDILIDEAEGKFSAGELNIEALNRRLDADYLRLLSNLTGGKYIGLENSNDLQNEIEKIHRLNTTTRATINQYNLWSLETVLVLIIILFAAEWFIRKKEGML